MFDSFQPGRRFKNRGPFEAEDPVRILDFEGAFLFFYHFDGSPHKGDNASRMRVLDILKVEHFCAS